MKRDSCFNFTSPVISTAFSFLFHCFKCSLFFFIPVTAPISHLEKKHTQKKGNSSLGSDRACCISSHTPISVGVSPLTAAETSVVTSPIKVWQEANTLLFFFSVFYLFQNLLRGSSSSVVHCVRSRFESNCNDTHRLSLSSLHCMRADPGQRCT